MCYVHSHPPSPTYPSNGLTAVTPSDLMLINTRAITNKISLSHDFILGEERDLDGPQR